MELLLHDSASRVFRVLHQVGDLRHFLIRKLLHDVVKPLWRNIAQCIGSVVGQHFGYNLTYPFEPHVLHQFRLELLRKFGYDVGGDLVAEGAENFSYIV